MSNAASEIVGDLPGHGQQLFQGLRFVYGIGPVARLDNADDFRSGVGNFIHAAHREINLVHVFRSGEVAGDGKGYEDGLVGNFRLAEVVHAHLEYTDDGKGDAADFEVLADGGVGAARSEEHTSE